MKLPLLRLIPKRSHGVIVEDPLFFPFLLCYLIINFFYLSLDLGKNVESTLKMFSEGNSVISNCSIL